MVDITAGNNEGSGILKQLYQRMENMSANHRQIAKNISEFKSGISSMGTWINNMDNNPLEIDHIVFGSDNGERFYHRNILERMKYSLSRFIFSFISDYDTIDTNFEDNITVWIGNRQYRRNRSNDNIAVYHFKSVSKSISHRCKS